VRSGANCCAGGFSQEAHDGEAFCGDTFHFAGAAHLYSARENSRESNCPFAGGSASHSDKTQTEVG
jgi:hypothetical protein